MTKRNSPVQPARASRRALRKGASQLPRQVKPRPYDRLESADASSAFRRLLDREKYSSSKDTRAF